MTNCVSLIELGCAFAQFKTKEAADKCIAAAQDEAEVICTNNNYRLHLSFLWCCIICLPH